MNEFLSTLLIAVITAAVPILTTYGIKLIKKAAERAAANTDDIKQQGYIKEIADAVANAVAATNQTYVDALKKSGSLTKEAQAEAMQKSLDACLAAISPAARAFAETAYGDFVKYITTKIEAEVRKQKNEAPVMLGLPAPESSADPTTVAASTAAATAATLAQADKVMQTAITQLTEQFASVPPATEQTT